MRDLVRPGYRVASVLAPAAWPGALLVASVWDQRLTNAALFPLAIAAVSLTLVSIVVVVAGTGQGRRHEAVWVSGPLGAVAGLLALVHGHGFATFDFLVSVLPVAGLAALAQWIGQVLATRPPDAGPSRRRPD